MDFSHSAEEQELAARVLAFARGQRPPARGAPFDRARWRSWGEFGLLGLCVPEAYGGLGLSALRTVLGVEAFARGYPDQGGVFGALAHLFACVMPVVERGSEELKQQYLPRLVGGEWVGANAISEPEAGSDVLALRSRAVKDGEHYVLEGTKSYVTNGPVADVFLVYAQTNPKDGYFGLSAFLVERGTPGVRVGPAFQTVGLEGAGICPVYFEECRVPASARVGAEGQGAVIFKESMTWERSCLFGSYLGLMERVIEQCVAHVRGRKQFGAPLSRNQAVSHRLADMKVRLESARLLLYRACATLDSGADATSQVAMAKLAVSEAAVQCGLDAVQLHGGLGVMEEMGVAAALCDSLASRIFSGTNEMQKELIAKGMGL